MVNECIINKRHVKNRCHPEPRVKKRCEVDVNRRACRYTCDYDTSDTFDNLDDLEDLDDLDDLLMDNIRRGQVQTTQAHDELVQLGLLPGDPIDGGYEEDE